MLIKFKDVKGNLVFIVEKKINGLVLNRDKKTITIHCDGFPPFEIDMKTATEIMTSIHLDSSGFVVEMTKFFKFLDNDVEKDCMSSEDFLDNFQRDNDEEGSLLTRLTNEINNERSYNSYSELEEDF